MRITKITIAVLVFVLFIWGLPVHVNAFIRGDIDGNGYIDIADIINVWKGDTDNES